MTRADDHETVVLDTLKRAVAEALERKRRLGQYAVVWRKGHAVCIGPDAPSMRYPRSAETARAPGGVAEPGNDE
ncbi:MAG: hypothetical protein ACYC7B_13205 [Burkholderiales bacterium]